MKIKHAHSLTQQQAYERVSNLLTELESQYADKISNPQTSWNPEHTEMKYNMKIMGFKTEGRVSLSNGVASLEGKLPFLAKPFKGTIEKMVTGQMESLFS